MKINAIILTVGILLASLPLFSQVKSEKYTRAEELSEEGKYSEAAEILEELCKEDPKNYLYFKDLGYAYLNMFDYDNAIKNFTTATELDSTCYKCYSHLARAWYEKGEYDTAERIVSKGFAISDTTAHLYMTRGLIYQYTQRPSLALADFSKAIELAPDDVDYYILRANYFIQAAEGYNAYSDISSAIKLDPENDEYYYYRAYILTNLNVQDEALIDIEKAISLNNSIADYYNLKFTIHMNSYEYDKAEQAVLKSIEIKPDDYYAYISLGDMYFKISNYDSFCEFYANAIELVPEDNIETKTNLTRLQDKYCNKEKMPYYFTRVLGSYINSNYGESISYAETGLAKTGECAVLHSLKGSSHLARQEFVLAETEFNKALELKSKLTQEVIDFYSVPISNSDAELIGESYVITSIFGNAMVRLALNDYKNALLNVIKAINQAELIDNFSGLEFMYITKGLIYVGENDLEKALKTFMIADEKNPYNGTAKLNIALITILKSANYKAKKLSFIYMPEYSCPRLVLPLLKPLKEVDKEALNKALEICNTVIENNPQNAYAYLLKSKIAEFLNDPNYCEYAAQAKELGIFNAYSELNIKCK